MARASPDAVDAHPPARGCDSAEYAPSVVDRRSSATSRLRATAAALVLGGVASAVIAGPIDASAKGTPRQRQEARYIEAAIAAAGSSACGARQLPAAKTASPPTAFRSILGVLRRPAVPIDARSGFLATYLSTQQVGLYENDVRFARWAFGMGWYVYVAGPSQLRLEGLFADPARCLAARAAAFRRELPQIPAALRSSTARAFGADQRGERAHQTQPMPPNGVYLFAGNAGAVVPAGASCGGATAAQVAGQGMFDTSRIVASGRPVCAPKLISGIVPDGVATVTFYYPAGRPNFFSHRILPPQTLTMHVVNNVVVGEPTRNALPPRIVWRAAGGKIVKMIATS
jgi:hypothetical protein